MRNSEAVVLRHSVKKVFLENSQIHRKTPVSETLLKKSLWHSCFPVNFAKFLRTLFLTEHLRWLLLETQKQISQEELIAKDSYESTVRFGNNKSPGNNELTKEFYQTF